jgi:hypothetical protein
MYNGRVEIFQYLQGFELRGGDATKKMEMSGQIGTGAQVDAK